MGAAVVVVVVVGATKLGSSSSHCHSPSLSWTHPVRGRPFRVIGDDCSTGEVADDGFCFQLSVAKKQAVDRRVVGHI